jgi:four helix bundle protein
MHTYKDLIVWQKSIELAKKMYVLTQQFPKQEQYGLVSQMNRAAVSIPSNIAEGKLRQSPKEFRQFLFIAFASGGELETQIEIAKSLEELQHINFSEAEELLIEIMKMLNKLLSTLNPKA